MSRRRSTNPFHRINRGRSLELAVIASQGRTICVDKFGATARFKSTREKLADPTGGNVSAMKGPVDFIGEVVGHGKAIHFDAKQTEHKTGFVYWKYLTAAQETHLHRHGEAGAISGVLIEGTDPAVAAYFWLDWRVLSKHWHERATMAWDMMTKLGDNLHTIRFDRVPEIAKLLTTKMEAA